MDYTNNVLTIITDVRFRKLVFEFRKEEENMLVPNNRSNYPKFSHIAKPIRITDILVSQKQGMGEINQNNQNATATNYLARIKHQMCFHGLIANAEHESMNFVPDPLNRSQLIMKQGHENEIVRLTSNEFFFYPDKPLSQQEFQEIIDLATEIGEGCHDNLHLVFASFPVEGIDNQIYNMVVHVQCGKNPQVNTFAKSVPSDEDVTYPEKNNRYYFKHIHAILKQDIKCINETKTFADVIDHISHYGSKKEKLYDQNVAGWLREMLGIFQSDDDNYDANKPLIGFLQHLYTKASNNQQFDDLEIAKFKTEMYAIKAQIGSPDVPNFAKTMDEVFIEIEKKLASSNAREMALKQLDYLEQNLVLPKDDFLTNINKIRTGIKIVNAIDNYKISLRNITDLIEQSKTLDSKSCDQFRADYTAMCDLLKVKYTSEQMPPNLIDERLKALDAGLEQVLQKMDRQQDIAEFETCFRKLAESLNKKVYLNDVGVKNGIKQNAQALTTLLTKLLKNLKEIYEINDQKIEKLKHVFDILLKKINVNNYEESEADLQRAAVALTSILKTVKQTNKLNDNDVQNQLLRELESIGNELLDVEPLKASIEEYQTKSVAEKLFDNIGYPHLKEFAQLAKEYQALREGFKEYKKQDPTASDQRLAELLTEHRKQLIPLLERMTRILEVMNLTDIKEHVDAIINSQVITEDLLGKCDGVVSSLIEAEMQISSRVIRSIDEMIMFLNFIERIDNLDDKAKKLVADLIGYLQQGTVNFEFLANFMSELAPYDDQIKNGLKYWNFPDESFNKKFNHNSTIKCKSAGGTEFYTAVEVCLDHKYEIAKYNLLKAISSSSDLSPLLISHLIAANSVDRENSKLFTPYVTHADRDVGKMGVYNNSDNNTRLRWKKFLLKADNVQVDSEYTMPKIEITNDRLTMTDPYFGPSELEFYKSPPHTLAPLALNRSQQSRDTYTREFYIETIENLLVMAQDQVRARDQHEEVNKFKTRLVELKSDHTLTGEKLLAELDFFKDKLSELDNSLILTEHVQHIKNCIYTKLLPPEEYAQQVEKDNCARAIKNMLIDPDFKNLPQEQADLITALVKGLAELGRARASMPGDFVRMVGEYKEKAAILGKKTDISTLNSKLGNAEQEIYKRLLPNEYSTKCIDAHRARSPHR